MLFSIIISVLLARVIVPVSPAAARHVNICQNVPQGMSATLRQDQNIVIHFCSGNTFLRGDLSFFNKKAVSLNGDRRSLTRSTVICKGESAGFSFTNISSVSINNIVIKNCGSEHRVYGYKSYVPDRFSSSILMNSTRYYISMQNCSILQSHGVGAVILQSFASISINNCTFEGGAARNKSCGGGGLYLDLKCFPKTQSKYGKFKCQNHYMNVIVSNSHFRNNSATAYNSRKTCPYMKFDNGGGLSFSLTGNANRNRLRIRDSTFDHNKASWGGGMNIYIGRWSTNNSVSITNCSFYKNRAVNGGGAVNTGYWFKSIDDVPTNNIITFDRAIFKGNFAKSGAGTYIFSAVSQLNKIESSKAVFIRCLWKGNYARFASAVYLNLQNQGTYNSRGFLPLVTFQDCTLVHNRVNPHYNYVANSSVTLPTFSRGKGCLFSIGYKINFTSSMTFIKNSGSALYLASSVVEINKNSNVSFDGNTGDYGGAVALFGSSILHVHDRVNLSFHDNRATVRGGAIYQHEEDTLEFISLKKCFLHYFNPIRRNGNTTVSLFFSNNSVIQRDTSRRSVLAGHSIYMHSLRSCRSVVDFNKKPSQSEDGNIDYRGIVAHVEFENSTDEFDEISTPGTWFKVTTNVIGSFPIVPGKLTDLPIEVNDDFNRTVYRVYEAILKPDSGSSNMSLDLSYTHIYFNKVLIYGSPHDTGNITFSLSSIGDVEVILPISLLECPPGFVSENRSGLVSCTCSLDNRKYFFGITSCNLSTFQAVLKKGYWLGCSTPTVTHCQQYILSNVCPRNFCAIKGLDSILLPNTSSVEELDRVICGDKRTGVLCGKCRDGHSAFYHSQDLSCFPNARCNIGWLFYLLSETLPVTLFFLAVILWDVQLTSGSVQGFILYSQLFGTLQLTANGQLPVGEATNTMLFILRLVLDVFNLDFFTHDKLSFCLWKNASSLEILTFKYLTVVYAFSLVILTILVLHFCKLKAVETFLRKIRGGKQQSISSSVIHGLSGFLVICYFQCTKISFLVLRPATVYSTSTVPVKHVAFFDGQLTFFGGRHLLHAIPAMLFVLTIVLLLPMLLLVYPLCYKVFSCLRIEESRFTKVLCRVIPLERMKPFFDSFQSCFRDRCRYFAGLYFVYRLSALLSFTFFQNLLFCYVLVEIQLVLMLAAHSWAQPYNKSWHNKLDTFLFLVLIVINLLTMFRYSYTYGLISAEVLHGVESVQIVIAFLPLVYLASYAVGKGILKLKSLCTAGQRGGMEQELINTWQETEGDRDGGVNVHASYNKLVDSSSTVEQ